MSSRREPSVTIKPEHGAFLARVLLPKLASEVDRSTLGELGHRSREVDGDLRVLAGMLIFDRRVPISMQTRLAREALREMPADVPFTVRDVLNAVRARASTYLAKPTRPFVLVADVSVAWFPTIQGRTIRGSEIVFKARPDPRFVLPDAAAYELGRLGRPRGYSTVEATIHARCDESAGEQAIDDIDILRAAWQLLVTHGSERWGVRDGALSVVQLGPVHTIHYDDGAPASDTHWYEITYREPIRSLELKRLQDRLLAREAILLAALRDVTVVDLSSILVKYIRALDEPDPQTALLRLWAVLEDLTLNPASHAEVAERAANVLERREYHRVVLHHLRQCRNSVAHGGGQVRDAYSLAQRAKYYVELLLFFYELCGTRIVDKSDGETVLARSDARRILEARSSDLSTEQSGVVGHPGPL